MFRQVIKDGWQHEYPEHWLSFGNPWEFERPEVVYDIDYGGRVEQVASAAGRWRAVWRPDETVQAVAYDTPIVGWRGRHVNRLRLWSARAVDPLRLDMFNEGDHIAALSQQARAEALSKILYPSDDTPAGRELRLRQEYFFVRRRSRTWCAGTFTATAASRPCRNRRRSSSTTPIQASRSPS